MPSWIARAQAVTNVKDIEVQGDKRKLGKKGAAQVEAAKAAASKALSTFDGPANVLITGWAQAKDETEPDRVHIDVVKADA